MSHFSKIKTNISNLEVLKTTLSNLGFNYKLQNSYVINKYSDEPVLMVYQDINDMPLFYFLWNNYEYVLIADLSIWALNTSIDFFIEKLQQNYALNVILGKSISNGFSTDQRLFMTDGSIKIILQKWAY